MRAYTEVDDDQWALTETILDNPPSDRRLVRTQIEELFALYRLTRCRSLRASVGLQ